MKQIEVQSSRGSYSIHVDSGVLKNAGRILKKAKLSGKVLIVTQKKVAPYLSPVLKSLEKENFSVFVHYLPDGETAKLQKNLSGIYWTLLSKNFERRDIVFALGGGVVGDIAGFAAATYLRGLPFANAGTTLLAQVDSAIGGKTGINLREGKNLIGAFYPPRIVLSDIDTLSTLADREFCASLAEVVKYGVIRDPGLFKILERDAKKILKRDSRLLKTIVTRSAKIKADVVSRDEFEMLGERMILNFGHTFGHGFEQASGYQLFLHGEAVSLGMVCAAKLAVSLKLFPLQALKRLEAVLRLLHLPVRFRKGKLPIAKILTAMSRDKKKRAGQLRFVLPVRIGKVIIQSHIPQTQIAEAIEAILEK